MAIPIRKPKPFDPDASKLPDDLSKLVELAMAGNQLALDKIMSVATPEERIQLTQWMNRAARSVGNSLVDLVSRTVNFPLHDWQRNHLCPILERFKTEKGLRIAIHAPPQFGKPQSINTVVKTTNGGSKRLGDIKVGDFVLTHTSTPREVLAVYDQGLCECVKITTSNGNVNISALDHPFLTSTGWINAEDLQVGTILGNLDTCQLVTTQSLMAGFVFDNTLFIGDRVVAIEPCGLHECRCLNVDHDHTYISDNLVVHNSIIVSQRFPVYMMCEMPEIRIGLGTHSITKSEEFGAVIRNLAQHPEVLSMYPDEACRIPYDAPTGKFSTAARKRLADGQFSLTGTGLQSGFVGRGFDLLILDDPYSPLATDTPIATPDGWSTMGDLKIGDKVFDHAGQVCNVTNVTQRWTAPRHRVWFSDNSYVDTHPSHEWKAFTRKDHGVYTAYGKPTRYTTTWPDWRTTGKSCVKKVNTNHMSQTLVDRVTMRNWTIPTAFPLELANVDLPIDPYILGYWLGDGNKSNAVFTLDAKDVPNFLESVDRAGYYVTNNVKTWGENVYVHRIGISTQNTARGGRWNDSLTKRLGELGVKFNKHIPSSYLRASYEQRLALLRGLMDSDGNAATRDGEVTFVNKNEAIIDGVYELIVSLGGKSRKRARIAKAGPKAYVKSDGKHFTITSYPPFQPFQLPRKAALYNPVGQIRRVNRTITKIDVLEDTDHLCITVDAPSHLFLAGRAMIPTCNSSQDAMSAKVNANVIKTYTSDIKTRIPEEANVIVMFHRYHNDDLAGYLIEHEGFTSIRFPALADENKMGDDPTGRKPGEVLSPSRSLAWLEAEREKDIFSFMGLFQGTPVSETGGFFHVDRLSYCKVTDLPTKLRQARGWDLAATEGAGDYTVGPKVGIGDDDRVYIIDMFRDRLSTDAVDRAILNTARSDGKNIPIVLPEDPGQAGKKASAHLARMLSGFDFTFESVSGAKWVRAKPFSSQVNAGNVTLVEAGWNKAFVRELQNFLPDNSAGVDDIVDSVSSAYNYVAKGNVSIMSSDVVTTNLDLGGMSQQQEQLVVSQDNEGRPLPIRRFYMG